MLPVTIFHDVPDGDVIERRSSALGPAGRNGVYVVACDLCHYFHRGPQLNGVVKIVIALRRYLRPGMCPSCISEEMYA